MVRRSLKLMALPILLGIFVALTCTFLFAATAKAYNYPNGSTANLNENPSIHTPSGTVPMSMVDSTSCQASCSDYVWHDGDTQVYDNKDSGCPYNNPCGNPN